MNYSSLPRTAIRFGIDPAPYMQSEVCLVCPQNNLIPFQIIRSTRPEAISTFTLETDAGASINLLDGTYMDAADEPYIITFTGVDRIIYKAEQLLKDIPGGTYFITISDGVQTWYSLAYIKINCFAQTAPVAELSDFESGGELPMT